eukprot:Nitzschia sp. Nitz4//scaffold186_size43309//9188//11810//NITZ4_007316-RA/size43309-augustus-gene-0.16-mRNA-1//-1//CDS//3329539755//1422//frame0
MSGLDLQKKAEEINLVLLQPTVDLWKLREFALTEGGLVNDTLRRRAWPKLVGLAKHQTNQSSWVEIFHPSWKNDNNPSPKSAPSSDHDPSDMSHPQFEIDTALLTDKESSQTKSKSVTAALPNDLVVESMDAEQIERDVERCTWHLLTTPAQRASNAAIKQKDSSAAVAALLKRKQRRLANMINMTLVQSYRQLPNRSASDHDIQRLRYYQGYHDVACIFMQVLGDNTTEGGKPDLSSQDPLGLDLACRVLCQVSYSHFRDNMRQNFLSLQTALKIVIYPLLAVLDRPVHDHLQDCDMEPFFCLSWVLTWFSHDVRDTNFCKRLFDAFISSHPLFVLYVCVAMMLHPTNRKLILQTDCDFAALHQCLASLPRNSSMVGWKRASSAEGGGFVEDYGGGDGCDCHENVSDGCNGVEEEPAQSEADPTARSSPDENGWDVVTPDATLSVATSPSSTQDTLLGVQPTQDGEADVPFQVLIEMALDFMKRYPPKSLMSLAQRYYRKDAWVMDGSQLPNMTLLQEPPVWSLVSTAPADWAIKQRFRQEQNGQKRQSLKRRGQQNCDNSDQDKEDSVLKSSTTVDYVYLKQHTSSIAVIAAGYGPGNARLLARKRQCKQLAGVVVVGVFATAVAFGLQQYYTEKALHSDSSSSDGTLFFPMLTDINPVNTLMGTDSVKVAKKTGGVLAEAHVMATSHQQVEDITSVAVTHGTVPFICKLPFSFWCDERADMNSPPTENNVEDSDNDTESVPDVSTLDTANEETNSITPQDAPQMTDDIQTDKPPEGSTALAKASPRGVLDRLVRRFFRLLTSPFRILFGRRNAAGEKVFIGGLRQWIQG